MNFNTKRDILTTLISLFFSFSIVSFFYIVFSQVNFVALNVNDLLYAIGKFFGLVAFLLLSTLIISGDLSRFFDKYFGMDRIIKFQRKYALFNLVFVLLHPLFFILSTGSFTYYLIPKFTAIFLALGIIAFYVFMVVMICSWLYKRISYNLWQYIHVLTYILFIFVILHTLLFGSDSSNVLLIIIYAIIIIFFVIGIMFRTRYKLLQRKNMFLVNKVVNETKDVFSLYLEPKQEFKFQAGQFCFLRINRDNLFARHPFTISSCPNDKLIRFTIKIYGMFTQEASKLKKGDSIFLEGPFGGFVVNYLQKDLVFIAGGIGITPFVSIIDDLQSKNTKQKMSLFYCTKTKDDLCFEKELNANKNLKSIFVLSKENVKGYEYGHINKDLILRNIPNYKDSLYYICGPEPLKKEVIRILKELNVKQECIHYESFFW